MTDQLPISAPVLRAVIAGTGSALPRRRVTNAELAETVDTSDEWIVERTGIRARHIAAEDETTSSLATDAARKALEAAGMDASEIGLIVLATATPDQTFPASATKVQAALGINDCVAFDVQAVCSGFLYALSVAESMMRGGAAKAALVIGAETFSRILDWQDRATCVLFGDGAGAVVLRAETSAADPADKAARGLLSSRLHADGRHNELLFVDGGPSTTGTVGKVRMKGREVFRHAVVNLASVLGEVLAEAGLAPADIDIVLATHLHFDHAGGFTVRDAAGRVRPRFPRAQYIVRRGEWEDATHPHARNRASYLADNYVPLADA
ncbi:MAG: beta-ketoacyl-ACP synthase 3, partial [Sphingomonas oligoaromativorans]